MKTKYYIQDSLIRDGNLYLSFFKDFYYEYAISIREGNLSVILYNLKTELSQIPMLDDGSKFRIMIKAHSDFDELILTDETNQTFKIQSDKIEVKELIDTKEDLISIIQYLERYLTDTHSKLSKRNKSIHDLLLFSQKQLDNATTILKEAEWLPDTKKIEEKTKAIIYSQLIQKLKESGEKLI